MAVFYKIMGGTPDTTISIPAAAATTNSVAYTIHVWRGADPVKPFAVAATPASAQNTGLANPPSVTTPSGPPGCVVLGYFAAAVAAAAVFANAGATPYDSTTNMFKSATQGGTNQSVTGMGAKTGLAVSTAFDAAITGSTTTNTGSWCAGSLVLAPPATIAPDNATSASTVDNITLSIPTVVNSVEMAIICGQSNGEGRIAREAGDVDFAGAWQFVGYSGSANYRTIVSDITPLLHYQGFTDVTAPADRLGPGEQICREILSVITDCAVLLVPTCQGSTGIGSPGVDWAPGATSGTGGTLFENMITQANLAYTAAQAKWPGKTINVKFVFCQGEQDAANGVSYATYYAALTNFIAYARSRVTGASSAPFIIGSMVPDLWVPTELAYSASYAAINRAHVDASLNIPGVYYVAGPTDPSALNDNLHYQPQTAVRTYGSRLGQAYFDSTGPTVATPASQSNLNGAQLSIALTGSDQHQTFHINGGADAALFEISDPYLSPTLRWASNGTGPGNGTYAVGVRARDGSGNYGTTKTINVTVANEINPSVFFQNSEYGRVIDLSDLTTLFQDIAGTTPVTAAGQSVGKILDKGPNLAHWTAAANDTTRPTYQVDSNGKPYLAVDGSNDIMFGAPYMVPNVNKGTVIMGLFGAAPGSVRVPVGNFNDSDVFPFHKLDIQTTGALTENLRVDNAAGGGGGGTQPSVSSVYDNTNVYTITAQDFGSNAVWRIRRAQDRPSDGGASAGYNSQTKGTIPQQMGWNRSSLGGQGFGTPSGFATGRIYSHILISRALTDTEVKQGEEWVNNRSNTATLPGQTAAGSSLVIQGATSLSTTGGPVITPRYSLVTANANSAAQSDNVLLNSKYSLALSAATSLSTADNATLTAKTSLALAAATSLATTTSPTLAPKTGITPANAVSLSTTDNVALTAKTALSPAVAVSLSTTDNVTLTPKTPLTVSGAVSLTQAANVSLGGPAGVTLVVQNANSAGLLDAVVISYKTALLVQNAASATLTTSPTLAPKTGITPASATSLSTTDAPVLASKTGLTVQGGTSLSTTGSPVLANKYSLTIANANSGSTATSPVLTAKYPLVVQAAVSVTVTDQVSFSSIPPTTQRIFAMSITGSKVGSHTSGTGKEGRVGSFYR